LIYVTFSSEKGAKCLIPLGYSSNEMLLNIMARQWLVTIHIVYLDAPILLIVWNIFILLLYMNTFMVGTEETQKNSLPGVPIKYIKEF
jgi:type IV secretory pathway VirB6-like protein